jgi:DNA invertase Pin-like site-specific DNA recombinase
MKLDKFKKYSTYKIETNNNNNVWVYTRVSSKDQFDKNNSITNQEDAAKKCAKNNSYLIANTFGGTYESAKGDFTRKEFTRLISEVKKSKNKPFAIMIYKMSRFSRSGASAIGLVNELIKKHNVHLIEVSTGKDSTTPRGELEIMESLQYARKENIERLEMTLPGMKAYVRKGNWLGRAPRGYDLKGDRVSNPKFKNPTQEISINHEGEILKKAWQWKLAGELDFEIIKKLNKRNLTISKQSLSAMWRKPFYCGINTHSLLEGDAIVGNWKPIVTEEDFLQINNVLDGKSNNGYKQSKFPEGRPLQSFALCGICGTKLTGYLAKGKYDYYKCQNSICTCKDLNATSSQKSLKKGINNLFQEYIERYELSSTLEGVFREQMKITIKHQNKDEEQLNQSLENQIKEIEEKLEQLEDKYLYDGLLKDVYNRHVSKLNMELSSKINEKSKLTLKISNLDKKVNNCVKVAKNVSKYWSSGSIENKHKIQNLLFPNGIVIDPENRQYRTSKVNEIFSLISVISGDNSGKRKDPSLKNGDGSCLVAGTGLEPVTFGL